MGLWAIGLGSGVTEFHFQLSVRIMAEADVMCVRLCRNMWWLRATVHGATVPLLDAFILLFVLCVFSCNILLISDLSPVFLKYRKLVNSFIPYLWALLNYLKASIHCSSSLSQSWLISLGTSRSPSTYYFLRSFGLSHASHYVDLEIKRIVSFRSWTDIKTTNSYLWLLGKGIYFFLFFRQAEKTLTRSAWSKAG